MKLPRIRPRLDRRLPALLAVAAAVAVGPTGQAVSHAASGSTYSALRVVNARLAGNMVTMEANLGDKLEVRTNQTGIGAWETLQIRSVPGSDPGTQSNAVALWSPTANGYVSAEFAWSGSDRGTLDARPNSTSVGPWETFYKQSFCGHTVFMVDDSSGNSWYVAVEQGGTGEGVLRARTSPADLNDTTTTPCDRKWELFDVVGAPAPAPPYANNQAGCADWPMDKYLQTPIVSGSTTIGGYAYGQGDHIECDDNNCQGTTLKTCGGYLHQYYALDIEVPDGTPLRAVGGSGKVLWAGNMAGTGWDSCGIEVVIDYGGKYWSVYCHLQSLKVATGASVKANDIVGYSGHTAGSSSFGPHLHMALFYNASITNYGGVYGGQSVKAHHMFHTSGNGGYYEDLDYRDFPNGLTITS
jgi:hypothetical protein